MTKLYLYRLEKEIELCENAPSQELEDVSLDWPSIKLYFTEFQAIPTEKYVFRVPVFNSLYDQIFRHYPIIRTKISKSIFESWSITHTIQDLEKLLKVKPNAKVS